ncbi:hypothetical protein PFICI_04506 [Pestalotiopsis fici W106-1]|uniref:DUF427 domain-containing protein n=1 Tax=Pestalotiopsis fici (strain W106-1 / CGMCC3.15140) TaxID=1229662 RepID=W3X999_PESFW|nr:uncharacterized protein PFICI_04506 [Pestalotiopsis fici W106-1]ETS82630.1 hypothetical protein PFICI_04506 [Pestalotiopsis fici W106-1]
MPSGHAKASVNGTIVADASAYEVVEGNVYFPPSAIKSEFFTKTSHTTHCPWKGDASYYTLKVGDKELENAAWYYPDTKEKANHIKDYVAFYKTKVDITSEE